MSRRGVAVAALVLVVALGACVISGDNDGDHHCPSPHACLAMLASGVVGPPGMDLPAVSNAVVADWFDITSVTLGVLVPPPKLIVSG